MTKIGEQINVGYAFAKIKVGYIFFYFTFAFYNQPVGYIPICYLLVRHCNSCLDGFTDQPHNRSLFFRK